MKNLGIVVLAAGLSARMNGPNKLLLPWREKPLVAHVLAMADQIDGARKALVTHRDADQLNALLEGLDGWTCLVNADTHSGLSSSLKLGLAELAGCTSVLVLLADMPDITKSTLKHLVEAAREGDYAVVPSFAGQWGNPVLLQKDAIADCAFLRGDQGARHLLSAHRDKVRVVEVDDQAIVRDFDSARDFDANPSALNQES